MREPRYLVDTSVLARADQPLVGERLEALAIAGRFWTCRVIDLELVYASRAGHVAAAAEGRRALPEAPVTPAVMDRALDIMVALAGHSQHRGVKPIDCIIAACAESAGLAVLHYDDDFDRIASVAPVQTNWVAEPASLDR
jgi:predicted nucleic acid-binding protein